MARRPRIPAALRRHVTERDGRRCAYCRGPLVVGIPMVVEHIIPLVITPLFHPRQQRWGEHFAWAGDGVTIEGLTPTGRATIALLQLNSDWLIQARRIWMLVGLQPPLE